MTSHAHTATKPKTKLTSHQLDILRLIIKGNSATGTPADDAIDMDQLIERCNRVTASKQSLQFTIRALVVNRMISKGERVKRRGRMRATYLATDLGRAIGGDRPVRPAFLEPEDDDADSVVTELLDGIGSIPGLFPTPEGA